MIEREKWELEKERAERAYTLSSRGLIPKTKYRVLGVLDGFCRWRILPEANQDGFSRLGFE
jgi:hypothetical protein